ncbi:MAG: hypothetical protein ACRDPM_18220 [Solirubrobacteraceae bacterium]
MFINRLAKLPWERWHPRLFAGLRCAGGVVCLALAAILVAYRAGGWWWPVLLVAAAVLAFYTAYRLPPTIAAMKASANAT